MSPITPPGPQHANFTTWAKARGVAINGIETAQIPGRGLGICATRKIKAGEEVITVPAGALFTIKSIPEPFRAKHGAIAVHGLLASFLAFGRDDLNEDLGAWKAVWPSMQDFQTSMPLLWPAPRAVRDDGFALNVSSSAEHTSSSCCFPLPPAVGGQWSHPKMQDLSRDSRETAGLLSKQEERLNKAWAVVSRVFPEASFEEYRYYWLVVNSRSFYWEFPGEKLPESHDDRMVLVPWADYFNHSDHGCNVSFDKDGYTFTTDREYDVSEELYTSYGSHSNDFLMVEYGFIMDNNKWDSLPLDDFFAGERLHENKKDQLKRSNYWGNYAVSSDGVCHRTQVAVRALTTNVARFKQFVAGREIDKEREDSKADTWIVGQILQVYYETAKTAIKHLEPEENDDDRESLPEAVRATLLKRWKQIKRLIQEAFVNGINKQTQAQTYQIFDVAAPTNE